MKGKYPSRNRAKPSALQEIFLVFCLPNHSLMHFFTHPAFIILDSIITSSQVPSDQLPNLTSSIFPTRWPIIVNSTHPRPTHLPKQASLEFEIFELNYDSSIFIEFSFFTISPNISHYFLILCDNLNADHEWPMHELLH